VNLNFRFCRPDPDEEIGALRHFRSACVDDAIFDLGDDVYVKVNP
jgi:hypothetical protein